MADKKNKKNNRNNDQGQISKYETQNSDKKTIKINTENNKI